jgi:tRNA modification GTPase
MPSDLGDTIVALATAPGPGGRAIVRLSGPHAVRAAQTVFSSSTPIEPLKRRRYAGEVHLSHVHSPLPATLLVFPGPRTYTGQDVAEIHTLSVPPLVDDMIAQLMNAGARAAGPGEFTMRGFLAGRRDLTQAEAVHEVITAANREELKHAVSRLAGGMTRPLEGLRDDLLNLLADVEAALDFVDEPIEFVSVENILHRLAAGMARVKIVERQLDSRAAAGRPFRAVLAGAPNTGKSSLFNALTGARALVSPLPGTTRDYLCHTLHIEGTIIEVVDTAGWQAPADGIERQAQSLGHQVTRDADVIIWCVAAGLEAGPLPEFAARIERVATKCDVGPTQPGWLATSAITGQGLPELRTRLAKHAKSKAEPAHVPSLSRCRHHVAACLEHLQKAHRLALFEDPPELLALELRGAIDALGAMVGAVYTDDLLDRIFSRFCIGK